MHQLTNESAYPLRHWNEGVDLIISIQLLKSFNLKTKKKKKKKKKFKKKKKKKKKKKI